MRFFKYFCWFKLYFPFGYYAKSAYIKIKRYIRSVIYKISFNIHNKIYYKWIINNKYRPTPNLYLEYTCVKG